MMLSLILAGVLIGSAFYLVQKSRRESRQEQAVSRGLDRAFRAWEQGQLPEMTAAFGEVEGLLADAPGALRDRAAGRIADLKMLYRLREIRYLPTQLSFEGPRPTGVPSRYAEAFRNYGIDVEKLDVREAAVRIASRPIRTELLDALDDWMRNTTD